MEESDLRTLRDSAILSCNGTLYWKDKNLRYLGCNKKLADILQITPSEIIGKNDFDLLNGKIPHPNIEALVKIDQEIMASGAPYTFEENGLDINGKPAVYLSTKNPIKNERGEIIGLIGNSLDITIQREAQLLKEEFMMNMMHNLRTPFCGMYSMTEILLQKENDEDKRELLGCIKDSSRILLNYLNDILLFKSPLLPEAEELLTLPSLVDEIIRCMLPAIKLKGLGISIRFIPDPFPPIFGKPLRVKQVLFNLVSNAIKFSDKGNIEIVSVLNNNILTIKVLDEGVGIAEDKLDIIFEPLVRLSSAYKGLYDGMGLGLSNVKRLVMSMGGKIEVESRLNQGTSFALQLPVSSVS